MEPSFRRIKPFAAIFFLAINTFAKNPVCDNYTKSEISYGNASCLAFDNFRFIQFAVREPLFSNGTDMGDSGTASFEEYRLDEKQEKQFSKDGIIFSVTPKLQYKCNYSVYELEGLEDDVLSNIRFSNGENFAINYKCFYGPSEKSDTSFAETEFQRKISPEDLYRFMAEALVTAMDSNAGDISLLSPWSFYRQNGSLKFVGNMRDGYCMNASGMKRTKRVTSPKYCK